MAYTVIVLPRAADPWTLSTVVFHLGQLAKSVRMPHTRAAGASIRIVEKKDFMFPFRVCVITERPPNE